MARQIPHSHLDKESPVMSRSIFQKICPGCMITLPLDVRRCQCGHRFDHENSEANLSSEEIRLQAEELYETYLAARVDQANNAVSEAQSNYSGEPGNQAKSRALRNAIQEAEAARAAYAMQAERVAEMRRALPAPVSLARASVVPRPSTSVKPTRVRPDVDTSFQPTSPARNTRKTVHAKIRSAKTPPAPTRPVSVIAPAIPTLTPNHAFRRVQAAKAEKILRAAEKAERADQKKRADAAPPAAKATAAPSLTKSAPRLLNTTKKDCPNCTASVDSRALRCRCGFEFPTESLIPSLTMSEEERAEFAKLFSIP